MKVYKSSIFAFLCLILQCLILLSGCGRPGQTEEQSDILEAEWKTNGFAVSGEVRDEQGFWVKEFVPWTHEGVTYDEKTEMLFHDYWDLCYGDKVYRLYQIVRSDNGSVRYLMEIYDTALMQAEVREIIPEQLGMKETGRLGRMDVLRDETYAFHVLDYVREGEEYTVTENRIQYLNPEGNAGQTDLLPTYLEKGIVKKTDTSMQLGGDCIFDGDGNSYVRSWNEDGSFESLYILDSEGKLLLEYKAGPEEALCDPMKTANGDLIFPVWIAGDNFRTRFVWFDVEQGMPRTLAELSGEPISHLYGMQGNELYYEDRSGIVRWDVLSGDRQLIFRFAENGITDSSKGYSTMLLLREGKPPVLRNLGRMNGGEDDWFAVLMEEPAERPDAVRVVSLLDRTTSRIKKCAAEASRRNRNYLYAYESRGTKDMEDYRTQIIAELAAGKGPDLLYVSRQDMELLQRRGLLADLRTLIPEETLEKVIPGVIELGTVDGTFVGMAPGVSVRTLMIGKDVWSGDSWTLDDVLNLMESGQLERRILTNPRAMYYYPLAVTRWLVDYNLENSFLIDWEKGESHFEDERFIRLLKDVGRYDNGDFNGPWDARAAGGGSLMVEVNFSEIRDILDFQGVRETEKSHYVGFPTESGNGNYLFTDGVLVVNKNLSDPEAVSVYLAALWGREIQVSFDILEGDAIPVTYLPTDDIVYDAETNEAWLKYEKLTVFEDGTTSLHEANALLAQCVPGPIEYAELDQIIYEELSIYFEDENRTAEDTAKVIDKRIQVYLDERN